MSGRRTRRVKDAAGFAAAFRKLKRRAERGFGGDFDAFGFEEAEEIETKCAIRFSGFGFRCPSLFGD